MNNGLLMDTHIWLWFAQPDKRLKAPGRQAIENAIATGTLRVSIMSIWEISLLEAAGHIHLGEAMDEWLDKALKLPGLQCLPLETPAIIDAHRLPGEFHRDPVDRLLVATARHHGLTLISEDRKILDYAHQGYMRACSSSNKELLNR